jgi:hypothetical protein
MLLCRSNCALPLGSDALIGWPPPNFTLSEEPSWGPKQCNAEAALEVILRTVAAGGGRGIDGRSVHLEQDGEGGKCVVCEQDCKWSIRKNSVAQMSMWLTSGHSVLLRTIYCEHLVFHACSETNYPDQSFVVFSPFQQTLGSSIPKTAYSRAGNHAALEESICGPRSPE